MGDSDVIKKTLWRIEDGTRFLQRQTGKIIDPPEFSRCFEALRDIEEAIRSLWEELDEWEREENS